VSWINKILGASSRLWNQDHMAGAAANMKRATLLAITLVSLAACTTGLTRNDDYRQEVELQVANEQASVSCFGPKSCDVIWQRTKSYVVQHSAALIRRADDAIIETKIPHQFGVVYVWASRTPSSDNPASSIIKLHVMCRGMYESDGSRGLMYGNCARQVVDVERRFHRFAVGDD
jgi:hypothetical protein